MKRIRSASKSRLRNVPRALADRAFPNGSSQRPNTFRPIREPNANPAKTTTERRSAAKHLSAATPTTNHGETAVRSGGGRAHTEPPWIQERYSPRPDQHGRQYLRSFRRQTPSAARPTPAPTGGPTRGHLRHVDGSGAVLICRKPIVKYDDIRRTLDATVSYANASN